MTWKFTLEHWILQADKMTFSLATYGCFSSHPTYLDLFVSWEQILPFRRTLFWKGISLAIALVENVRYAREICTQSLFPCMPGFAKWLRTHCKFTIHFNAWLSIKRSFTAFAWIQSLKFSGKLWFCFHAGKFHSSKMQTNPTALNGLLIIWSCKVQ